MHEEDGAVTGFIRDVVMDGKSFATESRHCKQVERTSQARKRLHNRADEQRSITADK